MRDDEPEVGSDERAEAPAVPAAALTIADAARAARTDRRAIRRLLDARTFPGAFKDDQGFWRIPSADLERAGLELDAAATFQHPVAASAVTSSPTPSPVPPERPDSIELVLELAQMEARAEKAEALLEAETRLNQELRNALDIERLALAALLGVEAKPAAPEPRTMAVRPNWQRELRAARAREQQQRAARARENQR